MTAGVSGSSAVLPSQWENEDETEGGTDDPVEITMDESDGLTGDAAESEGDDNSDDEG
jgi:hypothetical protein